MRTNRPLLLAAIALVLTTGCGKNNKSSSSSRSKDQGKTYLPDQKNKKSSTQAKPPAQTEAQTVTGKPSAPSDEGLPKATKNKQVLNPGAPQPPHPKP